MTVARWFLAVALSGLVAAGCAAGAGPTPVASASPRAAVVPSSDPDTPVSTGVPPGAGNPSGFDPNNGPVVVPKPGQLDVHPISAQTLSATVSGRRVVVSVAYASGVEPCSVLDSIVVKTGPGSFEITLREGHGPGQAICPDIAEFKRALVDLGELDPGTYTITDGTGGAAPINVAVG